MLECESILIKVSLATKIHTKKRESFRLFDKEVRDAIKDLDVSISAVIFEEAGYVTISLKGDDEIAAANYLTSLYGKRANLGELKEGDIVKGYICSSGKVGFGIFVDIGIKEPYAVDALLPMYALREQLTENKKVPVRKIIDSFGLVNNIPLELTIVKASIGLKKIEAKLSQNQLELFERWMEESLDRLYIVGAFENEIENALTSTNHEKDIISIEKLGWMENIISCKFNTSAKGLIPILGRVLPKAKFEIFSPSRIKKVLKEN